MTRVAITFLVLVPTALAAFWPHARSATTQLRYPSALALSKDGRWLLVANSRNGTVEIVDTRSRKITGVTLVGQRLGDLALLPSERFLLVLDELAEELVVLAGKNEDWKVCHRVSVGPEAARLGVRADGKTCSVTLRRPRELVELDLTPLEKGNPPRVGKRHSLPFAPRAVLPVPGTSQVVVADAFGGSVAVVDATTGAVTSVRTIPAHNIRDLVLTPDGLNLLITHQVLHRLGETTRDNVHWGNVITNNLRVLALRNVLDPKADLLDGSRLHQLGEPGRGGGDPTAAVQMRDGTLAVTLSGVGELAVGPDRLGIWHRVNVGENPSAVVASPDGKLAYVANTFADSVSVVDLRERTVAATIPLGEQQPLTAAQRGERLFRDARLSHDGWLSCHSCHTDGHTNGLLSDTLGDGSFGAPKRVLSLLGVRDTAPYAWNGSVPDLETQVRKSILTTMYGPKPSEQQVGDLTAYLQSLPAPPPRKPNEAARRGQQVFEKQGCAACHAPPTYTTGKTYDVGLKDELGNRQFNPPSLRGVGQHTAFFHDGRAATLEEVFTRHRHQLKDALADAELRDLLAFLRSL